MTDCYGVNMAPLLGPLSKAWAVMACLFQLAQWT